MNQTMDNNLISTAEIEPLRAEDLEAVTAIDTETSGISRRGYFEKRLKAATEHPRDYVYVGLHAGGGLVGFGFAKLAEGEFGQAGASASLDAIGVAPDSQGIGVGRRLLGAVEEILVHNGVDRVTTQVEWADRALLPFLGDAGFALDTRMVLARPTDHLAEDYMDPADGNALEIDHSLPDADGFVALSRDRIPVRSMSARDLKSIITIDERVSGRNRSAFYARKQHEVLHESGVGVSLVAELEGYPVGYIMARVDFGEFGRTGEEAVMDTIGVDPGYQGHGVGQALISQLMANLSALRVKTVRTEIDWNDVDLVAYFSAMGFAPTQRITLHRKL